MKAVAILRGVPFAITARSTGAYLRVREAMYEEGSPFVLMSRCSTTPMDQFESLLHRSATIRVTARGVTFAVLAGTLLYVVRYAQTYIGTASAATTTIVVAALVILEAVLFVFVKALFRRIA